MGEMSKRPNYSPGHNTVTMDITLDTDGAILLCSGTYRGTVAGSEILS